MSNLLAYLNLNDRSGRPLGSPNCTTASRLRDVARLVAQHYKEGEIATALRITASRARQLIREAVDTGLVARLEEGRDKTTMEMQENMLRQRHEVGQICWDILQGELNRQKKADELNTRFAFDLLDRTECVASKKIEVKQAIGVFSLEDLRKAKEEAEGIIDI